MLVTDLPASFVLSLAFVFGALWGSFFNVAIHRWPRDMSVVSPPSHCPACGKPIPPWRNLPILAYALQRGRAACCGAKMTPRYLVVEVLSGVLCTALAQRFIVEAGRHAELGAAGIDAALWFVFVGGLVIATFVDLEWMEIPDEVSIGGAAVGLATVALRSGPTAADVALGAGAGFLVVQIFLVWGWERFSGRRGMGEGDSKLIMMIGAFLGWRGALFALVAGAMQGTIAFVAARATGIGGAVDDTKAADAAKTDDKTAEPKLEATDDAAEKTAEASDTDAKKPDTSDTEKKPDDHDHDHEHDHDDDEHAGQRIPFGPFLALGALEFLFFGEPLVNWYLSFF